ncbi:hypothetical protein L7F22_045792 [Adiantum nelumboides]|nr:hypothetical protein [Adiantum nelumboides]
MNEHGLELGNATLVQGLYQALAAHDPATAQQLLAPELDFWYYGPPNMPFLKRVLTGEDPTSSFSFHPLDIFVKHNKIFVEVMCTSHNNKDLPHSSTASPHTCVHIWNAKDGRLVRLREYVDTSVNVMDCNNSGTASHLASPPSHHVVLDHGHHQHHHREHDHPIIWSSSMGKHVSNSNMSGPSLILYSP